jgi:hypothetical protein
MRSLRRLLRAGGGSAAVCIAVLALSANLAAAQGVWLEDPVTGCQVWNAKPKGKESISWSGGCKDGKASGYGVLSWSQLVRGGLWRRPTSKLAMRFEGQMVVGKAQGVGKMSFWDEGGFAHYQGEFKDSEMDGKGVLVLADKSRVTGDFKQGRLEGFVRCELADGARYVGDVKNNEPHGKGRQILADGEEYFGTFVDGVRSGKGTLLLPNGDIYTGGFKAGVPEGAGKLTAVDGGSYEGPFHQGEPHGTVVFTASDGTTRTETWKRGKKVTQ